MHVSDRSDSARNKRLESVVIVTEFCLFAHRIAIFYSGKDQQDPFSLQNHTLNTYTDYFMLIMSTFSRNIYATDMYFFLNICIFEFLIHAFFVSLQFLFVYIVILLFIAYHLFYIFSFI